MDEMGGKKERKRSKQRKERARERQREGIRLKMYPSRGVGKRGGRYALFQVNPHKQRDLTGNDTILPTRHPANVPRDSGEPYIDCLCMEPCS